MSVVNSASLSGETDTPHSTVWGKGAVYLYKDAKLRFGACLTVIEPAKDEKQRGIRVELKFPEGELPCPHPLSPSHALDYVF